MSDPTTLPTSVCPNRHENVAGAAFCNTCGAPLDASAASATKPVERPATPVRISLPKWLIALIVAGVLVIVAAGIAILAVTISNANAQAAEEAAAAEAAAAEEARLQQIPNAVKSCGVSESLVTNGGKRFAASTGFGGEIMIEDLECILTALRAPADIVDGSAIQLQAGDPPGSAGWGDFTLTEEYPYFLADISHVIDLSD